MTYRVAVLIGGAFVALGPAIAYAQAPAAAQTQTPQAPAVPSVTLIQSDASSATPTVVTLQDALQRARENDAQFQASVADASSAREDRVQAKAGLLPAFGHSTQYLGNQPNGVNPNGRFVSMDGVHMYRSWMTVHQELSPGTFGATPLKRAEALELAAAARQEIAERGLFVTVTRLYYALVTAERRYATAQQGSQQAARFLQVAQRQERLGQVARSDVVKAEISARQQQQALTEATLGMSNARLGLAVILFPTFNENFTVVDDLRAAPVLPPFTDIRTMAGRSNPDLRAADQALRAADYDVRLAKNALFPNIVIDGFYGIEANEFALHSAIAAQPELGVLPNLGYAVTVNLTVPIWDWGGLRSKIRQSQIRQRQATLTLSLTQRQLLSTLYSTYNEAQVAKDAMANLQSVAELGAESLRLTNLRYQAGESTALEVVDAQNTAVQARNAADDAEVRYRLAIAALQLLTGTF